MMTVRQVRGLSGGVASGLRAIWVLLVCATFGWLSMPGSAGAQSVEEKTSDDPALPVPLTSEAIHQLVSRLSDERVRQLLLDRLEADSSTPAADQAPPAPTVFELAGQVINSTASHVTSAVQETPAMIAVIGALAASTAGSIGWAGILGSATLLGLAGLLAVLADQSWHAFVRARAGSADGSWFVSVARALTSTLVGRLAIALLGVLLAFIAVRVAIANVLDGPQEQTARRVTLWLVLIPVLGARILTTLLEPNRPSLRVLPLNDGQAAYLSRNLLGVLILVCVALALRPLGAVVAAEPDDLIPAERSATFWINLLIFAWLAIIAIRARAGLSDIIRGQGDTLTRFEQGLAVAYPWLAVTVIALTWIMSVVLSATGDALVTHRGVHLINLVILLAVPLMDTAIRSSVQRLSRPMEGDGPVAEQAYAASLGSYKRMARVIVFGIVIAISVKLWDVSLLTVASQSLGEQFASHFIRAVLICLFGYLVWEMIRLAINRRLARERTETRVAIALDEVEGQGNEPVSSRVATLLPPISWALQAIVITMTALMALANIGIDITPLLAGAGVVGIAVGFGAQKLVSDVVSGAFFLFDDAFRLNEYIDAGGTVGTVEKISLRSIRLRDDNGPLYCIPYSEVSRVTNFGRDWGIMKLKFTVPFDTDPDKVRRIFKKIGQQMMNNPELAGSFIEPFKSQGVNAFTDTGIVVRGKFKFKPGSQFAIRREIFSQVQKEFAANGIEFARREVRVKISNGQTLTDEQASTIAARAAQEVDSS